MEFIDTHCHLDFAPFDSDREAVVQRALAADVTTLINPGADLESSRRAIKMAERFPQVYAAVGIHPHDAATLDETVLRELHQLALHPKVVAVGEIGLDYYRDLSSRAQQRRAFERQLALAATHRLPVIIHQRDAGQDVLSIVKSWRAQHSDHPAGVFHAFSGDLALARQVIEWGFYIGIAGPVTYTNARRLPEILPHLPVESLVVETDAPYLTPHPYRGQRNEPAYLPLVAQRLAELLHMPLETLAAHLTENARRLFHLPPASAE
ncbi:MAG: TatD family hydrolase [Anaerolineae bacterium]|nr:TatD family hydrolase [Anaerolineae bacterium]MDW8071019.1 TatD family hydrolase [Anaerolineae bacterium]